MIHSRSSQDLEGELTNSPESGPVFVRTSFGAGASCSLLVVGVVVLSGGGTLIRLVLVRGGSVGAFARVVDDESSKSLREMAPESLGSRE